MQSFHELRVWKAAHALALAVYKDTAPFPREEIYGLTAQMRRAASSVAANLAEGCARDGDAEFRRFCIIARGSASELGYHILLAKDLGYLPDERYSARAQETADVKRMLAGLVQKLTAGSAGVERKADGGKRTANSGNTSDTANPAAWG